MIVLLEVIVHCRWPLVALAYASPETMWLRVESASIVHHKYPIPEYSMINGNHEGHSSCEPPSLRIMLWSLLPCCSLYIMINRKGFPRMWLIRCYHWFNLTLCRIIAYVWEFIQDFLGLSQWQEQGNDMPVSSLQWMFLFILFLSFRLKMGEGLLDVTRGCGVFLWKQALYSNRIRFIIPKM